MCDIEGRAGRGIVDDARRINCCMEHRGGIGSEPNTGDGAGILTALPHKLLARFARTAFARTLPEPGRYGVGNVFLPHDPAERRACKERIEAIVSGAGPGMPWLARAAARPPRTSCAPTTHMQVVEQALDVLELRQIAGSRLLHGRDGGGVGNERSER